MLPFKILILLFILSVNTVAIYGAGIKDTVYIKTEKAGKVPFEHEFHLQSLEKNCSACHNKIFHVNHQKNPVVTMAEMEQEKSCGACHNGKDAFASTGDCATCHKGYKPGIITFKTDGGLATFSHDFHLQNYKCADCHTKLFPFKAGAVKASMSEMEAGKSCGACHNKGKDAFPVQDDCGKCHKM